MRPRTGTIFFFIICFVVIRPDETAYWDEILFFLFFFIICFVVIRPDETAYWDDHGLPELRARMPQVAMLMKTQVFFFYCAPLCPKCGHAPQDTGGVGFGV